MAKSAPRIGVVVVSVLLACGDDGEPTAGDSDSTGTDTSSGASTAGPSTGSTTSSVDDTGDGSADTTGAPQPQGCDRDHAVDLPVVSLVASDTDPAITDVYDHLYVEPDGPAADRLFVFLPGTGGPPAGYQQILRNAAAGGYHALGLSYVNDVAVNALCQVTEPGCHEAVRNEVITGEDTSALVDVSRADSIENRLVRALEHLGWTQYLDGDALVWDAIAFAGHSQGAGHAAFIAREHVVHRAVLFAGTEPADWTQVPTATATDHLYGFVHVDDSIYTPVVASWNNLGIPGASYDVDGHSLPFGDSHQLQTASSDHADNPHGSIVVDIYTPQTDGLPVYRDVWCYLIGP